MFETSQKDGIPAAEKRRLAIAAVVAEVGGIAVSRAVARTNAALADEVLRAVRDTVVSAYKAEVEG